MASKGRTALEAVNHALRLQSHGGRMGQFYVQRTKEHLEQCHDYFKSDVVEIKSNIQSSTNHSFKRFIYENIPQLKYRNKQASFHCTMDDDLPTKLEVNFSDGKSVEINTNQSQRDIYDNVVEVTKPEAEIIADHDEQ